MTPTQKLKKIAKIYETRTTDTRGRNISTHARFNLLGAYLDMERTGKADKRCLETIDDVMTQLAKIEEILGI